jgi:hypothetical protein
LQRPFRRAEQSDWKSRQRCRSLLGAVRTCAHDPRVVFRHLGHSRRRSTWLFGAPCLFTACRAAVGLWVKPRTCVLERLSRRKSYRNGSSAVIFLWKLRRGGVSLGFLESRRWSPS